MYYFWKNYRKKFMEDYIYVRWNYSNKDFCFTSFSCVSSLKKKNLTIKFSDELT